MNQLYIFIKTNFSFFSVQPNHKFVSAAERALSQYKNFNISNLKLTTTDDDYSIEIICGVNRMRDQSYLSSFGLFDIQVINHA